MTNHSVKYIYCGRNYTHESRSLVIKFEQLVHSTEGYVTCENMDSSILPEFK